MGRQLNFFLFGQDEADFLEVVKQMGDFLLDRHGLPLGFDKLKEPLVYPDGKYNKDLIHQFYISKQNALITKMNGMFIDELDSQVIQFVRSALETQNELRNGRLWYQTRYYDSQGNTVVKPDWLTQQYDKYKKWIIKNTKIDTGSSFRYYIGKEAYRMYKEQGIKMMSNIKHEFD
jgi:hypothetical protein